VPRVLPAILVFLSVFSATGLSVSLSGQDGPRAKKFDEFGDVAQSDLIARLDAFAEQLHKESRAHGFIIVYRSRRDLPGLSHSLAMWMKEYLYMTRGLPKDRIVTIDGGVAMCLTQELWIVPAGSAPTPRCDTRIGYFDYSESAWKFDEYGFTTAGEQARLGTRVKSHDSADYLEAYATAVKKKRNFIACIIAYAQYNPHPGLNLDDNYDLYRDVRYDPPGAARKRLSMERQNLMKVFGLPASRIRLIDGGYRKRRLVELWIVPGAEPLPIPTPNSLPPGRTQRQR
jgi:hypothetical protein